MVMAVMMVTTRHLILHHCQVLQLHLSMDSLSGVNEDARPVLHEVDDVPGVREHVFVVLSGIVGQRVPDVPVQDINFTLLKMEFQSGQASLN